MASLISTYAVAFGAMLFAAASALTLIYTVKHLDPPDAQMPESGSIPKAREEVALV